MYNRTVSMISGIRQCAGSGLDWLLPPRCVVTGEAVDMQGALAPQAWRELGFITEPMCVCCGRPFPYATQGDSDYCAGCIAHPPAFDRARAALVYNDASRRLVLAFKHGDHTYLSRTLAGLMLTAGGDVLVGEGGMITPVPLHRWRLLRRRYNQAALLARALARRSYCEYAADILLRKRATASQGHLGNNARHRNVRGAFVLNRKWRNSVKGRHIVLVDDVLTTGATVEECSRVLKKAGAARVCVLTLTRIADAQHA